jgi:hypothetical protein
MYARAKSLKINQEVTILMKQDLRFGLVLGRSAIELRSATFEGSLFIFSYKQNANEPKILSNKPKC